MIIAILVCILGTALLLDAVWGRSQRLDFRRFDLMAGDEGED